MEKIKLDVIIICEGKYDKIKLSSIFDATIITTEGFSIFKDKSKREFLKNISLKKDIVILTDSDSAGFKIRSNLKNLLKDSDRIYNIYIPDIYGKEKRKSEYSKEKKIGVEGIEREILVSLFNNFKKNNKSNSEEIDNILMYELGYIGLTYSNKNRKKLLKLLNLPEQMNTKSLLQVLNILYSKKEFLNLIKNIK